MKFVVISDSHGLYDPVMDVVNANPDADIFIHLGDYEIPEYLLNRFIFVKGNCDYFSDAKESYDIDYDFGKIHFEHGNHIDFAHFDEYVKSKNCFIFLFGHLHKKIALKIGDTYVFNPGSLTKPRDSNTGSYLIINIDKNKKVTYEFKTIQL